MGFSSAENCLCIPFAIQKGHKIFNTETNTYILVSQAEYAWNQVNVYESTVLAEVSPEMQKSFGLVLVYLVPDVYLLLTGYS